MGRRRIEEELSYSDEELWNAVIDKMEEVDSLPAKKRSRIGVEIIKSQCRCKASRDEDCICYLRNEARAKELERKMGKENFLKKRLVDELTQILIEYDCP